ncbi:hypothetical protein GCM10022254_08330 [Actinomadura meridiana]|uniref:Uncharacterized protein n=1 Tax=Actinomadura meridiana TaxID=559626 RepID=A0ABP8BTE0_9ACTN
MDRERPATRAAESGVAGDARVAGPAPKPPVINTPGPPPKPPVVDTPGPPPPRTPAEPPAGFLAPDEAERLRKRWHEVQSGFVDDPDGAVRRADELASDAVDALGHAIAAHRRTLSEDGAADRERPDTERLRQALRGYRDLLNRVIDA